MTRFYWTAHPGDLLRGRLLAGESVLIVASAFWDDQRQRFKVSRPPADHIGSLAIDSGGFTAAARWGRYPWTPQQYIDWIREEARDVRLDWCAIMDYACEREVHRGIFPTNAERITATQANDATLRALAPDLPWLSVLQGNTFEERQLDLDQRAAAGLLFPVMGIGSICRRAAREAAQVIRWYGARLPATRYHAFGLDIRTLDQGADVPDLLTSWDSYAWNWPAGAKNQDRDEALIYDGGNYSAYLQRVAQAYQATLAKRQRRATQPRLL